VITSIPITYLGNTLHTDTLAAGPDGALWSTGLGTLFRLDLSSGTVTNVLFPTPASATRPIEPTVLYALSDRRLYFDDKGSAIYDTTPPNSSVTFFANGTNIPHQGGALAPTSMALVATGRCGSRRA
jgi:hypothetical protein